MREMWDTSEQEAWRLGYLSEADFDRKPDWEPVICACGEAQSDMDDICPYCGSPV